jgi:hypothetical protein
LRESLGGDAVFGPLLERRVINRRGALSAIYRHYRNGSAAAATSAALAVRGGCSPTPKELAGNEHYARYLVDVKAHVLHIAILSP